MSKVLVVDDSALMRKYLQNILQKAGFETDYARNGQECLEKIKSFNPDAITLDLNMPIMDGMTCLAMIMRTCPKPVVMVSSETSKGAESTFEALELGAVDYVTKSSNILASDDIKSNNILVAKVRAAIFTRVSARTGYKNIAKLNQEKTNVAHTSTHAKFMALNPTDKDLIVIGVSTGGPTCLQEILQNIPSTFNVPIVIAQHMPARFTKVFSERLDKCCPLHVQEVSDTVELKAGCVYLAKGDADAVIKKRGRQLLMSSVPASPEVLWHPSVSMLVASALEVVSPKNLVCVQLTGMGNDGADSMAKAFSAGAITIAESEETAVVYGMPKELVNKNAASFVLPNYKIADAIIKSVSR
jgi:two-component system chemotaxis response regulator CheB